MHLIHLNFGAKSPCKFSIFIMFIMVYTYDSKVNKILARLSTSSVNILDTAKILMADYLTNTVSSTTRTNTHGRPIPRARRALCLLMSIHVLIGMQRTWQTQRAGCIRCIEVGPSITHHWREVQHARWIRITCENDWRDLVFTIKLKLNYLNSKNMPQTVVA